MRFTRKTKSALHQIAAIALGLVVILPIIYALLISFTPASQILAQPPRYIPREPTLSNYEAAVTQTNIFRYMLNSLIISLIASIARIITGSMAAFAFAFMQFRGKRLLFMLCFGTTMIPIEVVLVANYQTTARLGLINTYLGMCIIMLVNALNIFLLRQHFLSFPRALEDAARIDGCTNFGFFVKILLPASVPVVTTVFIQSFISTWNTYLWPLIVTNSDSMRTVQIGITMLNIPEIGGTFGPVMAGSMIVLLPTIGVFMIFQRRILAGLMTGAVKE